LAALLCLASAGRIENYYNPGRIPGEYLITLNPIESKVQRTAYVANAVSKIKALSPKVFHLDSFDNLRAPILHVYADEESMVQALELPEVVNVEANVMEKKIEQCGSQSTTSTYWGLSRISSRAEPSYGSASYSYRTTGGNGVRVYVLDTGIRTTHQDFQGRAIFGTNTIGGGNSDVQGHGTHCAGTVAGIYSGVGKASTVVSVKVLNDQGFGTTSAIVNGINWAVGNVPNRGVISMSLGGGLSSSIDSAVESAYRANVPVVAAAGNDNANACNGSPSGSAYAITVGATDNTDTLSSFSNWGSCVDILAPGSNIRSASNSGDTLYRNLSGTSMACPAVAGAAAIYLQQNPGASSDAVKSGLTGNGSKGYINLRGTSGTPNTLLYERC
jgi:subtilisin family serine protease